MKIIDSKNDEIEISNTHWPLAEDLFVKWGMTPNNKNEILIVDVNDITSELSAWGIPWRYTKWSI